MNSKKLLWIGWDGADWEHINPLLERGLLPNLDKLINEGCMGNLATLEPVLSPMLWNSAATGKHAYKHGILGFTEPDELSGGIKPFSSTSRRCKALWNIFSQLGWTSNVINWWASHPAEPINGCIVSNLIQGVTRERGSLKMANHAVHPPEKAGDYARYKVFPEEIEAEQICAFIPHAARINQDEDSRLETFAKTFAETLTTHAVATAVLDEQPWDFSAIYYTCIDHFSHAFMPYHPPQRPNVSDEDFEIFKDVIDGAYRFSDMMLGRVLDYCHEDTTIVLCSDHGFESGSMRPTSMPLEPAGPAVWHRKYGIIVVKGPNIRRDERIFGASLIDIAPTLLTICGLPVGDDMDGRPLTDIFENPPEVKSIPSWDDLPGEFDPGMPVSQTPTTEEEAEELVKQFVALGYIDDPQGDKAEQFEAADIESKYNCARNLEFGKNMDEALVYYEEIVRRAPWESRFILKLAHCYQRCEYWRQALKLIESAFDVASTRSLLAQVLWVETKLQLDEFDETTLEVLASAESKAAAASTDIVNRIAMIYARLRRWQDAERVYGKSLEMHPENATALQGLSRVYLRQRRYPEAADVALQAVGLVYRLPHAHLNLGIALAQDNDLTRAIQALETALKFSPRFLPAHRMLASIYAKKLPDEAKREFHQQFVAEMLDQRIESSSGRSSRREQVFELPDFLTEAERAATLRDKRPRPQDPRRPSGREFVIVSGLPRSGTSLMMQMLDAGGLPAMTDGERIADADNPKGYFEWEAIKQIKSKPSLLDDDQLDGKAIKTVSMLLTDLPYAHRYKVIFMTRPIDEVFASQSKMLDRLEREGATEESEAVMRSLLEHRNMAMAWARRNPRVEILEVDFPTLIDSPQDIVPEIVEFLGEERLPNVQDMGAVVDKSLYRQRTTSG